MPTLRNGPAKVYFLNPMELSAAAPGFLPALIDAGNGVTFTMLGTSMRLIVTGAETGGRYTVLEQVTPAGWGPPRHIHSREDEIFYVLEGTYEVRCFYLVSPERISGTFGLKPPASDADTVPGYVLKEFGTS